MYVSEMFATGDNMATAMHIMLNSAKTMFFQYGNLKNFIQCKG